jgi:hypothetical protein
MADALEQVRIWRCRVWRRRWLCLGVSSSICAPGWIAVGLLTADRPAVLAGFSLALVMLAGAAAGVLIAALVGGRAQVFDSVAELRRAFDRPVLGGVAEVSAGPWRRATAQLALALACLGLVAGLAGLLLLRTSGLLAVR